MRFRDRHDAGRRLADRLAHLTPERPVVFGLPRGGVPVAHEVARVLGAPLDVLVVRKLGCPWQPELGLGAIGEGGIRLLNQPLIDSTGVGEHDLEEVAVREGAELERRVRRYRGSREAAPIAGRTVIVVDDGLATGFTARAAIEVLRHRGARRIVLAVPVAPARTVDDLRRVVDEVVCLHAPETFWAIGQYYDDFDQVGDDEVADLLATAGTAGHVDEPPEGPREVVVTTDGLDLPGTLRTPPGATGIVLFAHGSGSSRLSPRNQAVADALHARGIATLLFDLLTPAEAGDRARVFDIPLLAERLVAATRWVREQPDLAQLRIGYFGASTGAGAALWAAASLGDTVAAVVSRGGRPDLAAPHLGAVTAPTLLVVGSRDEVVLELNARAQQQLRCANQLAVVPGATHLFEEPGALEQVAGLAGDWFVRHLATSPQE
jgi:putative phosphoribosyl transferase